MFYKVIKNQLKKSIVLLRNRVKALEQKDQKISGDFAKDVKNSILLNDLKVFLEEIEFAVYKTKLKEFYIDYEMAKQIRSILNSEDKNK